LGRPEPTICCGNHIIDRPARRRALPFGSRRCRTARIDATPGAQSPARARAAAEPDRPFQAVGAQFLEGALGTALASGVVDVGLLDLAQGF
jgi:hypothetical protein